MYFKIFCLFSTCIHSLLFFKQQSYSCFYYSILLFFFFVPFLRGCSNRLDPRTPTAHAVRSEPVARRAFIPLPESQSIRRAPSHLRSIDAQDHTNANLRRLLFREELFSTYIHTHACTRPRVCTLLFLEYAFAIKRMQ